MSAVRDTATVRVSGTVDGTKKRKRAAARRPRTKIKVVIVDGRIMKAAKRARREGEKIVIVDENTVLLRRAEA